MTGIVLFLFFASGLTALVYEVLWERLLHLTFGLSTYSVTAVTAAFMLGLALGYFVGKSRSVHKYHPLLVYGLAEGAIGLAALVFSAALPLIDALYVATGGVFVLKFLFSFALLVLPTTLMGLTLPVLTRYLTQLTETGRSVGLLYAVNTCGGVLGVLLSGLVLLRTFGVTVIIAVATCVNLGIGVTALMLWRGKGAAVPAASGGEEGYTPDRLSPAVWLSLTLVPFLVGAGGMALEVLWTRTLICVVSNNTHSFAIVVASVLFGIALGSWLYAVLGTRVGPPRKALLFCVVMLGTAMYVVASISFFNRLYDIAQFFAGIIGIGTWWRLGLVRFLSTFLIVLLPAVSSGFSLPLLVDILHARTSRPPNWLAGVVFSANTLGSVAGALLAGFVLIPLWGIARALVASAVSFALLGVILLWVSLPRLHPHRRLGVLLLTVVLAGLAALPRELTLTRWFDGLRKIRGELLFHREGAFGTIAVFQVGERKELTINCIEEVPNHRDALLTFKLLAHFPLLLHEHPRHVLVNAVGGGITLGAVVRHDVYAEGVDIVPAVVDVLPLFAEENGGVVGRKNWRFIADDGRNYLKVTAKKYDVITADATHPAAADSWVLYTKEYYELVKTKLGAGGIFAQWLPLHGMAPRDYLAVLKTFSSAFPETLVLFVNRYTILIGSLKPLVQQPQEIAERMRSNEMVYRDLQSVDIATGRDLLKYIILDSEGLKELPLSGIPLLTDYQTSVEFAELNRLGLAAALPANLAQLIPHIHPERLALKLGVDSGAYQARWHFMRALVAYDAASLQGLFASLQELDTAVHLSPDDADIQHFRRRAEAEFLDFIGRHYPTLLNTSPPTALLSPFQYAGDLRPQDPFFKELLGITYMRLERWAEAVRFLEEAVIRKPHDVTYLSNLAHGYDQLGRYADALRVLRRADRIKPGEEYILRAIREVEEKMKDLPR